MKVQFLPIALMAVATIFTSCEKDNDDNLFENIDELYVSATREANASRITISDLEAELAASQSEADSLTVDLASALSGVASLTASVSGLEGDNVALVSNLTEATVYISALQVQEAALMDDIDSIVEALQVAKAASQVDADLIIALNNDLVVAIASQNDLQADLDAANAIIAALRAQVASLQAQLAAALAVPVVPVVPADTSNDDDDDNGFTNAMEDDLEDAGFANPAGFQVPRKYFKEFGEYGDLTVDIISELDGTFTVFEDDYGTTQSFSNFADALAAALVIIG